MSGCLGLGVGDVVEGFKGNFGVIEKLLIVVMVVIFIGIY